MKQNSAKNIDQLLPQTQCQLCGYGGCLPYAEALAAKTAPLDRCLPGGVKTLQALGTLLEEDISPLLDAMQAKQKKPLVAVIDENLCIGCTKCLPPCPVDAIIGAHKQMHTVIAAECTGCELCVPACPMDCIELVPLSDQTITTTREMQEHRRKRYQAKQQRMAEETLFAEQQLAQKQRQAYIAAAIKRVAAKKGQQHE